MRAGKCRPADADADDDAGSVGEDDERDEDTEGEEADTMGGVASK